MTTMLTGSVEARALNRLEHVLDTYGRNTPLGVWRWAVLQRMAAVRDVLARETPGQAEWLSPRRAASLRERNVLLDRMSALRFRVLADADVDRTAYELRRLLTDVRHHVQRLHDLAYDEVEAEVGGSE